jgi:hypothetical protein
MNKTTTRIGTAILLLALTAVPASADETRMRSFNIRILESDVAEKIVLSQCGPAAPCEIVNIGPTTVEVLAESSILNKISAALAAAQKVPSAQVFQVTMVEAINNGDSGIKNVPQPAREALMDARSFLPFNGYRLLGTAVLRTADGAAAIVNGPDDVDYNCEIRFYPSVTHDGLQLVVRRFLLQRMPPQTEYGQYLEGASAVDVLNTSFSMKPGETVVVGTSKLEGADRALVVLLTALPS